MSSIGTIERVHRAMRFPVDDLEQIDARARSYGMTRTHFMIDAALDRLPNDPGTPTTRLDAIEERLDRLEASQFGSY